MDQSDFGKDESTLREIAKAQKTLDEVENKMKNFKNRKRQSGNSALPKAPYPDLNKYFSYLSEEHEYYDETLNQYDFSKEIPKNQDAKPTKNRSEFNSVIEQQNNSLSLNQKLENQKKSSISKIQEYYIERNEALENRIKELKQLKEKMVRDQKLLVRNNEELQMEIQSKRHQKIESSKLEQLKTKVQKMRKKINDIQRDNANIIKSKQEMEKHIRQALRGHKTNLKSDLQVRHKSISQTRCRYH